MCFSSIGKMEKYVSLHEASLYRPAITTVVEAAIGSILPPLQYRLDSDCRASEITDGCHLYLLALPRGLVN
ncbi:hypothetical protein SETIT_4G080000v2 [Setaria italica]|uniref:Uncharacterized protein n=2 Tax=Setaria TaxID=4554 RepID=A0A368QSB9_SETIT|nr:hypothetical protein SETIT_4G080000v2 [Setaria italica]TKW20320.1 hypothetical protein SEVIR_4G079000v2 [Setaria viridis]